METGNYAIGFRGREHRQEPESTDKSFARVCFSRTSTRPIRRHLCAVTFTRRGIGFDNVFANVVLPRIPGSAAGSFSNGICLTRRLHAFPSGVGDPVRGSVFQRTSFGAISFGCREWFWSRRFVERQKAEHRVYSPKAEENRQRNID